MDEFDDPPRAFRPKPSKTPSWVMIGFIAGALFVWALPRPSAPEPEPPPPVRPKLRLAAAPLAPRLSDVEAVFAGWGHHAVWADDITYVALWDSESRSYRDVFEVLRRGDELFFRGVPRPRRLRVLDGVPRNSPLQFFNPVPEPRGIFNAPPVAPESIQEEGWSGSPPKTLPAR